MADLNLMDLEAETGVQLRSTAGRKSKFAENNPFFDWLKQSKDNDNEGMQVTVPSGTSGSEHANVKHVVGAGRYAAKQMGIGIRFAFEAAGRNRTTVKFAAAKKKEYKKDDAATNDAPAEDAA